MKTFLTILMALFISHISFATNVSNAEAGKNGDKDKATEKQVSQTKQTTNRKVLPCTQSATVEATITFENCEKTQTITYTSVVTCNANASSCEEATFLAQNCAFQTAWTNAFNQIPNCPPVN